MPPPIKFQHPNKMTAIPVNATPIRQEIETPFWEKAQFEIKLAWEGCKDIYYRHSDLLSQLTLFSLNTTSLASKIFHQIPPIIPRLVNTALSFTSLLYLNMQIRDLLKTGKDLSHHILAGDLEGIVFTAARVSVKALNLLLGISLLGATITALCGSPAITLAMYGVMRPFALFSFLTGIGLEVYDYQKSGALVRQLKKIENCPEKITRVTTLIWNQIKGQTIDPSDSDENRLARHTFCQLEHYYIEMLQEELKKGTFSDQDARLIGKLKEAFEQKQLFTQANLGLIALGYACMGICKVWPDTLIQSTAAWGISLLYTSKLVYQKITQQEWQESVG